MLLLFVWVTLEETLENCAVHAYMKHVHRDIINYYVTFVFFYILYEAEIQN